MPAFPNATYWVSETQWNLALNPNKRERASFLTENILPLRETGKLKLITIPVYNSDTSLQEIHFSPSLSCYVVNGHTQGMLLPKINTGKETIVYMADLLPSIGHIPIPYVMGYDTRTLLTLPEKSKFLNAAADNNYYLFLEHDAHNEIITVEKTEKGIRLADVFKCDEILK